MQYVVFRRSTSPLPRGTWVDPWRVTISGIWHVAAALVTLQLLWWSAIFFPEPKAAHLLENTRMLLPSAYTLAPLDRKITESAESPFTRASFVCLLLWQHIVPNNTETWERWVTEEHLDLCRLQHSTLEFFTEVRWSQTTLLSAAKITPLTFLYSSDCVLDFEMES